MKSKVHFRNRNHTGWWLAVQVEMWVSKRQKKLRTNSRILVWENMRLIRASSREEAYRKAMKLGRVGMPGRTDKGEFRFKGLSMLVPVYEEIEDGAEILWTDRGWMTFARAKKIVKRKTELEVFDDREVQRR